MVLDCQLKPIEEQSCSFTPEDYYATRYAECAQQKASEFIEPIDAIMGRAERTMMGAIGGGIIGALFAKPMVGAALGGMEGCTPGLIIGGAVGGVIGGLAGGGMSIFGDFNEAADVLVLSSMTVGVAGGGIIGGVIGTGIGSVLGFAAGCAADAEPVSTVVGAFVGAIPGAVIGLVSTDVVSYGAYGMGKLHGWQKDRELRESCEEKNHATLQANER